MRMAGTSPASIGTGRGEHIDPDEWRAPLNLFLTEFPLAAAFSRRDCQKIPFGRINNRADNSERQWQAGALAKSYQCAWGTHGLIRLIRRTLTYTRRHIQLGQIKAPRYTAGLNGVIEAGHISP
jgi:hypothetical protein